MRSVFNAILIPLVIFCSNGVAFKGLIFNNSTLAQEINSAYFTKAPRLLGASTTSNTAQARGAKYYFNLELPPDAGTNLQKIAIAQREGQETIDFKLEETVAYIGTNRDKKTPLAIAEVTQNQATGEILITLAQPISPNTTFTIGLKPKTNPFYDGVYLFGVTAFPQGNNPQGLYLGVGRLHFYRGNEGFFRN